MCEQLQCIEIVSNKSSSEIQKNFVPYISWHLTQQLVYYAKSSTCSAK